MTSTSPTPSRATGRIDLVWIPPWISQVEYLWSEPSLERVMARLTQFARVITFDRRGSGLSDPLFGAPTLEEQMDDVLAVMDAAGSERAAICGTLEGGPMAALFAATFPERTDALVLYATFARATWAPDYEWAWPRRGRATSTWSSGVEHWGEGRGRRQRGPEPDGATRASWSGPAGSSAWPPARRRSGGSSS